MQYFRSNDDVTMSCGRKLQVPHTVGVKYKESLTFNYLCKSAA